MPKAREYWAGAVGVVVSNNKILMVKEKVSKRWSVPFGKIEEGESAQQACIREVREETGIIVSVEKAPHTKKAVIGDYDVEIYYFRCEMCAGEIAYADPDREIE
ncbi:hypothetical protein Plano_1661 [Planococcus sp. PAMC 21323]|uniref:NUDIX domain-containing protein n=1 Tax=Planococcus sp. PAMC 21323 TaxID=1526927 RepID=UPI0005861607|nr:NUDIX domain-containing protein [Planococcus sp. PAMC 21323]AIY05626.1 hypothetical protein Plano_1661 [Planococcus sp. PAMC 21323]